MNTSIWLATALSGFALEISSASARGADFTVLYQATRTYTINGVTNTPALTLMRGETYTFEINTPSSHPFQIRSPGVSSNNIYSGLITYTVPMDPSNYTYVCSRHLFGNTIFTVPTTNFRIRSLSVGSNIVLRSTGPSNYDVMPEFKTDLSGTNWFALTVQTNSSFNGTNETVCGNPLRSNAFIRIKGVQR